ncbi:nucleotidyltransferase family protein [uncultured Winogradskyella sp.]|uniref:nucleotidyltransferase family protein n=1 Tax=uncultured Winogradskyella sp. TaxID=395353 RepID=UPI0030DCC4FF|tara:strand:- start:2902 stop:3966 length:1065 start_codon:yes stop_codon:yes gene_type:complete
MGNLAITYQHIANILSFETSKSKLEKSLSNTAFDWDAIVVEGSRHLVLPAIYCRLQSKQLLHTLPEELKTYLDKITSINRNRNKSILKQVNSIAQLLNRHHIDHTFLKGSALIAAGYYEDFAERMIGDIDILVAHNQLDSAYKILKDNDYIPIEQTLGEQFFEHKHLPRLKPKDHICAVEIHRKLFVSYKVEELKNENILLKKRQKNNISIPSQTHLLMHNILNYQVNDKGTLYNSINLRSAYDTIVLQRDYNTKPNWYNYKIIKRYFKYTSLFFNDIKITTKTKSNLSTSFYIYKLNHTTFYKSWNQLLTFLSFIKILCHRLYFFMRNKSYRNLIIKDRKRIYRHFLSTINNL